MSRTFPFLYLRNAIHSPILSTDYELVRLQEDVTLAGFTPLKNNTPELIFCRCDIDIEIAQVSAT